MSKVSKEIKKTEKQLIKELHELIVLKRLVEKIISTDNVKKKERLSHMLDSKIKREEHIEKRFNKSLNKLENSLKGMKRFNPDSHAKLMKILQNVDIYKNNLVTILSKGGELEKVSENKDLQAMERELVQAINDDNNLSVDIKQIKEHILSEIDDSSDKDYLMSLEKLKQNPNFFYLNFKTFNDSSIIDYVVDGFLVRDRGYSLDEEEKRLIKETGIFFRFEFNRMKVKGNDYSYVVFFDRFSKTGKKLPVKIVLSVESGRVGHRAIIGKRDQIVITAGIIMSGQFSSYSDEWTTKVITLKNPTERLPAKMFGKQINNILLEQEKFP